MEIRTTGTGYDGLVSGANFADFGQRHLHHKDARKVETLKSAPLPIDFPDLENCVAVSSGGVRNAVRGLASQSRTGRYATPNKQVFRYPLAQRDKGSKICAF